MADLDKSLEQQEANELRRNEEPYHRHQRIRRHDDSRRREEHSGYFSRLFGGGDTYDTDADDTNAEEEAGGEEEEYSEKEQLTAFLLSFFLGWTGAGRFYVGDYAVASIKLCMPLIICCVTAILLVLLKQTEAQQRLQELSEERQPLSWDSLQEVGGAAIA
eukprot:CAMPEP_0197039104 /NCGR_PEP_ID=MMETSP1384-20130603/15955_1 /TAXON_ID=29189 /ORGANISM="Ammonia sp." /LENGTH=160 /DNA_ID=CAMNT_0042469651 /DNA_START=117 /DNA_END=596 /DNA_ORIENTATION=-